MGIFDRFRTAEKRNVQDPTKAISASDFHEWLMGGSHMSAADVVVNTETALGVPAVASAVNFLSGTMAGLPCHVYTKTGDDRRKMKRGLAGLLHDAPNEETSSFEWRKNLFTSVFTGGRGFSWIERRDGGEVIGLWNMDPSKTTIERRNGRKFYTYDQGGGKKVEYPAADVIDIPFMLKNDGLAHRGPITMGRDAIGMAIAATNYGAKFFAGGGVPPFVVTGSFSTEAGLLRAGEDLRKSVTKAAKEKRTALTMPAGLDIKALGADPEKSQLVELQRFCIEQIARIYSMPPTFLQDLTHGTFSNTEQQDLHFVKHTLKRWVEQFEQEMNLKLFGMRNNTKYVELNMDGLLRGDFKSRMEGYGIGIQNAILQPDEARALENRPAAEGGDKLYIQGATVPVTSSGIQDGKTGT